MKEYLPWSVTTYHTAIEKYKHGRMSILDVQLSGMCPYNCMYCDSPDRDIPCSIDFDHFYKLLEHDQGQSRVFDWVFICGLGEPVWSQNKRDLLTLLRMCEQFGLKCTIFTNGNQIDEVILDYVEREILYPIIKLDTFSLPLAAKLYGVTEAQAQKTLSSTEALFKICREKKSEYCNVAVSIVPTSKNKNEILNIVRECEKSNVYPLLGQLENAGRAIDSYQDLLLTKDELMQLKSDIERVTGEYHVPICPSVISGVHIKYDGWVSVDKVSGLSCSWFWLETPQIVKLCDINRASSFIEAEQLIFSYRNKVLDEMVHLAPTIEEYPFGGCGGNVKSLAEEYIHLQKSLIV